MKAKPQTRNVSAAEIAALRRRIEAANLSQRAAGDLIYTPERTMQDWLGGQRPMHRAIYERLLERIDEAQR